MKPKRTILCVDDNESSLSIRKVMLETRGYRVLACTDAATALETFRKGGIDLLLTETPLHRIDEPKIVYPRPQPAKITQRNKFVRHFAVHRRDRLEEAEDTIIAQRPRGEDEAKYQ